MLRPLVCCPHRELFVKIVAKWPRQPPKSQRRVVAAKARQPDGWAALRGRRAVDWRCSAFTKGAPPNCV